MKADVLPRRFLAKCPRCSEWVELSLDHRTFLTYSTGNAGKGHLTVEVGASGIEHTCSEGKPT